jgi:hypothetical protein
MKNVRTGEQIVNTIWDALHGFRETCIPEGTKEYDEQWDEIGLCMDYITYAMGYERDENGDLVYEDMPPEEWEY